MREIKFRVFNKEDKLLTQPHAISEDIINNPDLIVMQFTGLKDKNGKEIYEGDIIHISETNSAKTILPAKYEVKYFCDGFKMVLHGFEDDIYNNLGEMPNGFTEVIGNIYETPELLK